MSEAIENGQFLDGIQRLDKAAQNADIDDEPLERFRHPEPMLQVRSRSGWTIVRYRSFKAIG